MKELEPILRSDHTDAERILVRSAQLDVPPADGKGRVLAALGAGAGVTTAGTAAAAKSVVAGLSATTKWVAIGAIGVAAVGGFHALAPHGRRESVARPAPSSAPSVALPSAPPKAPRPAPSPEPTRAELTPAPRPAASAAPAGSTTAPSVAPSSSRMSGLGSELEYLDVARRALAKSDPAGALHALDLYARRFPQPNFEEEANLLRVEAWLDSGRRAEARALAEEMLARDPKTAYAQRLRSLFGEPPAASGEP